MEGNLRFKIDWAGLIVESRFTVFTLFYFVFDGHISSTSPRRGRLYLEGRFNGGFFGGLYLEGLLHGGAYFRNFTVIEKYNTEYSDSRNGNRDKHLISLLNNTTQSNVKVMIKYEIINK